MGWFDGLKRWLGRGGAAEAPAEPVSGDQTPPPVGSTAPGATAEQAAQPRAEKPAKPKKKAEKSEKAGKRGKPAAAGGGGDSASQDTESAGTTSSGAGASPGSAPSTSTTASPARERKKKKAKEAAPPAPPRSEVLSVEEAERRYGAMLRAPKTPTTAPVEAEAAPVEEPAPPPSPADDLRRREAAENRRKARVPQFQGLLSRADALLAVPEAELRHLRSGRDELRERWRSLGVPPADEAVALLAARDARLARFDARIAEAQAAVGAKQQENLAARRAIVDEARALAEREDLRGAGPAMGELRRRLRACGPVAPDDAEAVAAAFAEAEARLRQRQEQHRTDLDAARREQIERLERLVRTAESLVTARDPEAAAERAKTLQAEWKTVRVPGPRGEADALWTRFRAACDAVFARRTEARTESHRVVVERLEAIVRKAELFAEDGVEGDAEEAIHRLITDWKKAGRGPREVQDALWERLQAAFGRMRSPQVDLPTEPAESLSFRPFEGLTKSDGE